MGARLDTQILLKGSGVLNGDLESGVKVGDLVVNIFYERQRFNSYAFTLSDTWQTHLRLRSTYEHHRQQAIESALKFVKEHLVSGDYSLSFTKKTTRPESVSLPTRLAESVYRGLPRNRHLFPDFLRVWDDYRTPPKWGEVWRNPESSRYEWATGYGDPQGIEGVDYEVVKFNSGYLSGTKAQEFMERSLASTKT